MTVKCKRCGTVWADKDQIVASTRDEHQKAMGHQPEVD